MYDYDLLVIGAGSGGVRAARFAASMGARVAVAEDRDLGGTCVNVGCVPKKLFVYASEMMENRALLSDFGISSSPYEFDWPTLRDNKSQEISRLNGIYGRMLENAGVEIIRGRGVLKGGHEVQIGDRSYSAKHILIAVGGWPFVPDIPGHEHLISSNEMFYLDSLPEKLLIIGGGYIAVEFAGIFNGYGCDVSLHYRGEQILRGFDREVRDFTAEQIRHHGVNIQCMSDLISVEKLPSGKLKATLKQGEQIHEEEFSHIMMATGRKPKTTGLGLETCGISTSPNGAVIVDDQFRTSADHIYAIGDVIDRVALTPVALAEGMFVARHLFSDQQPQEPDYQNIPTAVFSQPPVATVGVTEEEAVKQYSEVDVYSSSFRPMKYTMGNLQHKTLMKLLVDRTSQRVIGAHMVGPDSAEIMQGLAIAIRAGATKADFDQTIGIHPSAAEEFVTMREPTRQL